jgi:hypothetical protein
VNALGAALLVRMHADRNVEREVAEEDLSHGSGAVLDETGGNGITAGIRAWWPVAGT